MIRAISGRTRVVGIIADPIAQVRTPRVFNALMSQYGCDAVMVPLHVPPAALDTFMAGADAIRNLAGLVVTVPHKEAVLRFCDVLTPAAEWVRAVNVIRFDPADGRHIGTNTDGEGFMAGLQACGRSVDGKRAYIAGAGGAAKAVAAALLDHGATALGIHNRTAGRAVELVERLRSQYADRDIHVASDEPEDYGLAVNATSLGLQPSDPLPFRVHRLASSAVVAEVVMSFDITPLLSAARDRGLAVHLGSRMLDGQIASMARFLGLGDS